MKRNKQEKNDKNKLALLLLLILTFGIGLGYAVLSQQLSITNTVNYGSMKWNIGFTDAANHGGSITASPTVSTDKKTITIGCDLGTSTKSETCIVKAKVKNDSTFAIKLEANPQIELNSTYINKVETTWVGNSEAVVAGNTIGAGAEEEIQIKITTNSLSEDLLPSSSLSIPVTITMNWLQLEA